MHLYMYFCLLLYTVHMINHVPGWITNLPVDLYVYLSNSCLVFYLFPVLQLPIIDGQSAALDLLESFGFEGDIDPFSPTDSDTSFLSTTVTSLQQSTVVLQCRVMYFISACVEIYTCMSYTN